MERKTMHAGDIKDLAEDLKRSNIYFILGSNTLWIPSTQTKVIDIAVAKPWPDINGEVVPMAPGEAARVELDRAYPDLKRVGWFKGHVKQLDWRPPLYCDPIGEGYYTQVDLTSAYWQVYRWLWVNTPFPLGYGTLPLYPVAERLKDWKQARNSLIGITRARGAVAYKNGQRLELKTRNNFLSPGLWATVQAVLNEIAVIAIDNGAVYVNTDGYIFPQGHGCDFFCERLEEYGFLYRRVTEGIGEVAGWCCYKVGSKSTHLFKIGARPYGKLNAVRKSTGLDFISYLTRCRVRIGRYLSGDSDGHCNAETSTSDFPGRIPPSPGLPRKNDTGHQRSLFD